MIDTPPAIHAPIKQPINLDRLIWALAQVESGGNWALPGGALQFTARTWAEETRLPYILSQHRATATAIAKRRLENIERICVRFGVDPTPAMLSSAWRFGLSGAMKRAKAGKVSDYETRAVNLYNDKSP